MFDAFLSDGSPVSWLFLMAAIGFGAGVIAGFVSRSYWIASS